MSSQVIVVGGGLAGLSAVHTLLERGANVVLLERNAFMGGNSTKATSGINAALTRTQIKEGVKDSEEKFLRDTALSASKGASDEPYPLARTLVAESAPAVHWLQDKFKLDLSILGRLGGHSEPRTHRGTQKFPGMTITMALMDKAEQVATEQPERLRIFTKAMATELIKDGDAVVGVKYEKDGETHTEHGAVILATGGYGYDNEGLLKKYRPELGPIPTTNGPHCDGSGIKMAEKVGGGLVDMEYVQVHPTGLVNPAKPDDRVKFLAAEALRGAGGVLIDADGKRFCNELGRRDYVSGEMAKGKGPFRLLLNKKASSTIHWHVVHYEGRGLMKHYKTGADLAKDMGISPSALEATFKAYNKVAESKNDPFGKKFFANAPLEMSEDYYVGIVTPVVHYTMGGVYTSPDSEVLAPDGKPVPGLYATGEVMGGTHGKNRLGGSSLLDCVVFGRVSGASAAAYQLSQVGKNAASRRLGGIMQQLGGDGQGITMSINPSTNSFTMQVNWGAGGGGSSSSSSSGQASSSKPAKAAPAKKEEPAKQAKGEYTLDEVAKHNKEDDCWVVVGDQVLDVTKFMADHPGGKTAILLFAGKDATEEFDMLHERSVIEKYAPYTVIGTLKK